MKLQASQTRFIPGERIFDPIMGVAGVFIEYLPDDPDYACRTDMDRFGTVAITDIDRLRSLMEPGGEEVRRARVRPPKPSWPPS